MRGERRYEDDNLTSIDERKLRAAAVAQLYHLELINSWSEIARRLGIDRRLVRSSLRAAHGSYQLVDVRVHHPLRWRTDLADRALSTFRSLRNVVAVEAPGSRDLVREAVGRAAAYHLDTLLGAVATSSGRDELVIALSWGSTVAEMAKAPPPKHPQASVVCVPAHGNTPVLRGPQDPQNLIEWQANEVARRLADRLRGVWYPLSVPALVRNPSLARSLAAEPLAAPVLALARRADIVVVGMGTVAENAAFIAAGVLDRHDLQQIRDEGGVGHICGRFFREDGQLCEWGRQHPIIGLGLEELQRMVREGRVVLGVAAGREKSKVLLGAIRARAVNHIVTDATCCEAVLDSARRREQRGRPSRASATP